MIKSAFLVCTCLLALVSLQAQAQTVSGRVTSGDDGEALPVATVQIKGSSTGTTTDMDGRYTINASATDVLIFSYVGFLTKEITVGNQSTINVVLEYDVISMDEVVVVGYGTIRKSDLTGAVSSVKSKDLTSVPLADPVQALQGKVAGLQVLNTSGNPGAAPVLRLRGVTTLNDNSPIFVVDGVIIEGGNSLDFLNSYDISSVEVLKDASATSIFGSRGSNGVIIVTTKRGEKGDVRVSFNTERAWESIANKIDVMNGREFATYVNGINPGTYNNFDLLANTDWQDLVYENLTPIGNYSLSLSSATDKIDYYFSLGYYSQKGIMPKSDYERITAKINTNYTIRKGLKLGLSMAVAIKDKANPPGIVNTLLRAWPLEEPFNPDGSFAEIQGGGNALAAIEYTNNNTKSIETVGNLYTEYSFLDAFSIKSSFQFSLNYNKNKSFTPEYFVAPLQQNETSDISLGYSDYQFLLWENTISYNKEFGDHRINAVLGYTAQEIRSEFLSGSGQNLLRETESFWYINASDGDPLLQSVGNSGGHSAILSTLFRVNYSLRDKYLFTVTGRRDGSSKFGANNRYGIFPSIAFGYNISEEPFFPANDFITNLKLRASWGVVGNDKISGTSQYSLISSGIGAVFGTNEQLYSGATYSSGGNPSLKWEETQQLDIGLNAEFWDGRLSAEIDYYRKITKDILVNLEPLGYSGIGAFQSIVFNAANVENSGLDMGFNWRDEISGIKYGIGVIGSTVKNKVLDLGEGFGADSVLVAGDLGNGQRVSQTVVGQPIGFFYGYDVIGVFQNQGQLDTTPSLAQQRVGDFIYRDANGDGVLNPDDRVFLGSSIPSFIYGFSLEAGYKGFTLNADFQGQMGVDVYNGKQAIRFALLNYEDKFNGFWTGENSTNENARPTVGGINFTPSSYFIEDGSFFRLRSLTLNYDIPQSIIEKVGAQSIRAYVRGTNLFTKTKFSGYSPDLGASNALDGVIDRGVYPITKIIGAGINATF